MGYSKIIDSVGGLHLSLTRLSTRTAKGYYPYHRYSTRALAIFAASRGIEVTYPRFDQYALLPRSNIKKAIQRADDAVLEALQRAEEARVKALRDSTFRFLDLPPELRNMVYEELLTIEDGSFTCHPQVLRTCKEIRNEATSVLYAANVISVYISETGIKAHNIRCGNYCPVLSDIGGSQLHQMYNIEWPEILCRAREIDVWAIGEVWHHNENLLQPLPAQRRTAAINNVFAPFAQHCAQNTNAVGSA